jgi:hypothetical protein
MRVVAELPHPGCKITIFSMNQKYIVKFEQGSLEQSYKVAELNLSGGGVNDVFELLDEEFINTVLERFKTMHTDFKASYDRYNF